jgi:hypothetical protein
MGATFLYYLGSMHPNSIMGTLRFPDRDRVFFPLSYICVALGLVVGFADFSQLKNASQKVDIVPNEHFLGQPFPRNMPTRIQYTGVDGCYIAVYSHDRYRSAYSVGNNIYVVGSIRVQGYYQGTVCQPKGYEGRDISTSLDMQAMTNRYFPGRKGGTWPGGYTGR